MRVLLTGKNGQVGFELQRALAPLAEVHAVGTRDCDFTDLDALRALIRQQQPGLIINTAAYTAVDRAESEPDRALALNAEAPRVIGEEAQRLGAAVFHFSTDYVFDGLREGAYSERDATAPQSAYGRSKLAGEHALAQATPRHLIMRTSWVMGAHGHNFAKTMLRKARTQESLKVVNDQHGAPTSAALLADVTAHLVQRLQHTADSRFPFGTYHVTAAGDTSWHALTRWLIERGLEAGQSLKARADAVQAISTQEFGAPAPRPANSRLDCSLFQQTFGLRLPPWQHGIGLLLQQLFEPL